MTFHGSKEKAFHCLEEPSSETVALTCIEGLHNIHMYVFAKSHEEEKEDTAQESNNSDDNKNISLIEMCERLQNLLYGDEMIIIPKAMAVVAMGEGDNNE